MTPLRTELADILERLLAIVATILATALLLAGLGWLVLRLVVGGFAVWLYRLVAGGGA